MKVTQNFGTPAQMCFDKMAEAYDNTTKQSWLEELRNLTGQDFGDNVAQWRNWIADHPEGRDYTPEEEIENEKRMLAYLRDWSGQDFGDDIIKWSEWIVNFYETSEKDKL